MCPKCKGEMTAMLKSLEYDRGITFTNVPVVSCGNCNNETIVSFDHGLMIDDYKRNHCKDGETVDFSSIQPIYAELNVLDFITLENNPIQ